MEHAQPYRPAILVRVYNRPDLTSRLLSRLETLETGAVYFFADGPRSAVSQDYADCMATRKVVKASQLFDEPRSYFSPGNLGCRDAMVKSLEWFFERETSGLVLEDDCVPEPSFFSFVDHIFKNHLVTPFHIHISGYSPVHQPSDVGCDYFESAIPFVWGWATTAETWSGFPENVLSQSEPDLKTTLAEFFPGKPRVHRALLTRLRNELSGADDNWDTTWLFHCLLKRVSTFFPVRNLVTNTGFGGAATHATTVPLIAGPPIIASKEAWAANGKPRQGIARLLDEYILFTRLGIMAPWLRFLLATIELLRRGYLVALQFAERTTRGPQAPDSFHTRHTVAVRLARRILIKAKPTTGN